MNDKLTKQLRKTIIALLDDENGVNSLGALELKILACEVSGGEATEDIFKLVEACQDRYYLPENHGLTA